MFFSRRHVFTQCKIRDQYQPVRHLAKKEVKPSNQSDTVSEIDTRSEAGDIGIDNNIYLQIYKKNYMTIHFLKFFVIPKIF